MYHIKKRALALAAAVEPVIAWCRRRMGLKRGFTAAVVTIAVTGAILALAAVIVWQLIRQAAELLGQLLDTDAGSRSIGEVALVPASSPINRSGALFYSTLFDENAACHIAFGASYPGTTEGGTALTKEELLARGMNQSAIHEDVMIGAEDSHITGKCRDGRTVELFKDGVWVL